MSQIAYKVVRVLPMAKNPKVDEAYALFKQGLKLIDISKQLDLPEGTVRRWKCTYDWGGERSSNKKPSVRKKHGGQPGNKNAVGHGAPKGNSNAVKYGFMRKYLPDDTWEIFAETGEMDPLDLLWTQIQISYAAILRAQKISYVKDQNDKTTETTMEGEGVTAYSIQQAWEKHENFLKAQSRAQSELRSMIKQYDDMLDKRSGMASEEQKARIALLKAKSQTGGEDEQLDDGFLEALNGSAKEDWKNEESNVPLPDVQPEAETDT